MTYTRRRILTIQFLLCLVAFVAVPAANSGVLHAASGNIDFSSSSDEGCPGQPVSAVPVVHQTLQHLPGIELWFDDAVLPNDLSLITDGLKAAQSEIATSLASHPPPLACFFVRVLNGGPAGSALEQGMRVLLYTTAFGWPEGGISDLQRVAAHEYVHVWQASIVGQYYADSPVWLNEGIAEWIALKSLTDAGIATGQEVEAGVPTRSAMPLPPLQQLERSDGWGEALQPYPLSLSAVSLLVSRRGPAVITSYLEGLAAGPGWQSAFRSAFGVTASDFYQVFDQR